MFIGLLNNNQTFNVIFLIIIGVLLSIIPISSDAILVMNQPTMPFSAMVDFILPSSHLLHDILGALLIILLSIIFNNLITAFEIIKNTFLPGFFFLLLCMSNAKFITLGPISLSLSFLLLAINELFILSKEDCRYDTIFNTGFLVAISSLFFFPVIYIYPLMLIGIVYFRNDTAREFMISITGLLIPYLFLFTYLYWNNEFFSFLTTLKIYYLKPSINIDKTNYFFWGITALLLFSVFTFLTRFSEGNARIRKFKALFFWILIFTMLIHVFSDFKISDYIIFISIPAAVFFTDFFQNIKKQWISELLVLIMVGLVVYNQIITS